MPALEVILQSDVEPLGRMGDVVKVSVGYARNYLFPRRLAVRADSEALKRVEKLKARRVAEDARRATELQALSAQISSVEVVLEAAASETGQLYGSVGAREIAAGLEKKGVKVADRDVRLEHPLRELGAFPVKIHLRGDLSTELKVTIVQASKGVQTKKAT